MTVFEEADHNSRACFCACKMRKADRNQFSLNAMNVPDKKQLSGERGRLHTSRKAHHFLCNFLAFANFMGNKTP